MELNDSLTQEKYYKRAQKIGAAARFLHFQSIRVPSKRADGDNCVIFMELIDLDKGLIVQKCEEIDLKAEHR